MSPQLVVSLTFVSTALLVAGIAVLFNEGVFRYRNQLGLRLDELSGQHHEGAANTTLFDLKQLKALSGSGDTWRSRVAYFIEQSGVSLGLDVLVGSAISAALILAAPGYAATRTWWVPLLGAAAGLSGPIVWVRYKHAARLKSISRQLPDLFDVMARSVRAGQTIPATFQLIATEFESPVSDEFARCHDQQSLGLSFEVAVRELARQLPAMELQIFVVALLVQSRSGGNLVQLLSNLASMARKRLKMQQRLRALTGEARMQAWVLIVLPLVALLALLVLSPDYAATLFARPWLLAATAVSELIGALWIRKIIAFEV